MSNFLVAYNLTHKFSIDFEFSNQANFNKKSLPTIKKHKVGPFSLGPHHPKSKSTPNPTNTQPEKGMIQVGDEENNRPRTLIYIISDFYRSHGTYNFFDSVGRGLLGLP